MIALIAEKPSVARDIATLLGATQKNDGNISTLAMICSRYLENKKFVPQKYWQLKIQTGKDSIEFSALSEEKFYSLLNNSKTRFLSRNQ